MASAGALMTLVALTPSSEMPVPPSQLSLSPVGARDNRTVETIPDFRELLPQPYHDQVSRVEEVGSPALPELAGMVVPLRRRRRTSISRRCRVCPD
jgi:hypothetical protein